VPGGRGTPIVCRVGCSSGRSTESGRSGFTERQTPSSNQPGSVCMRRRAHSWMEANSTKTLPCRNSVHHIKSWPAAAKRRSLEQNPPSSTKEVKDLVPRNKRYFSIQYVSSGLVQLCWCINVDRFVMLSLNRRVWPLSGHLFRCVDVSRGAFVVQDVLHAGQVPPGCTYANALFG
jgi:hypothetical protein